MSGMQIFEGDTNLSEFGAALGLRGTATATVDIHRPWMDSHKFRLVRSVGELNEIVDAAIAAGECALDLETEGLDNRIFYDASGKPFTKHRIVGFCLSYNGDTGYYVPVGHKFDEGPSPMNLPRDKAEQAITRLCQAAQPAPKTPETLLKDPLSFREFAEKPKLVIYFWNAKFDQEFLYPITGIDWWHPDSFEDGNLAYYTFYSDDKQLGLKWKAFSGLRDAKGNPYEMIELKELFEKGRDLDFSLLAPDEKGVIKYACSDAICTFLLCRKPRETDNRKDVMGLCHTTYAWTYRLEKQCAQAVRWMERPRVRLNRDKIQKLRDDNLAKRDGVLSKIVELAAGNGFSQFDPKSTKVLGEFLFGTHGLNITVPVSDDWPNGKPPLNEKSGQFKTDADTLERLVSEHQNVPEVLKWIVEWRGYEKMDSTYLQSMVRNLDDNSEMRFQFKQTGAATGRFSAPAGDPDQGYSGIPIHGIPATSALRTCFEARPGYTMLKADYAGEELRIAANTSSEMVWINEFLNGDGDLHTITAKAFFPNYDNESKEKKKELRKMAKIANFALLYGGGPASIMRATGCDKLEATRRKQAFDKAVPTFASWIKGQHKKVKQNKGVWTAFGRWIAIPDIDSIEKAVVAACERKSTNFPTQGCLQYTTNVLTTQGWKCIGDLVGHDSVTVWTGSRWAAATAHSMGKSTLASITLSDGTTISCDVRHKLMIVTDEGQSWVDFENLQPEMLVARSLHEPIEFEPTPLPKFHKHSRARNNFQFTSGQEIDFWYWMGRYVGDGWIDDDSGGVMYTFGVHEQEAVDACVSFWKTTGLNPTWKITKHFPRGKEASRILVSVYGVNLSRWLQEVGFRGATAHTKRLHGRIFVETLVNRRAFIRGIMDSDGNKTPLPKKVNGVWDRKVGRGNPYNVHLCQRPLLEDIKLVLRSVGVESNLRGPYTYPDIDGVERTSYLLSINRRMYERHVMLREGVRLPKMHDMFAPRFLVNEFLSNGPWPRSAFKDESSYVLYLRLKVGGKVTVYTFKHLCESLNVSLSQPIYGFKRLVSKEILSKQEETYTLSVNDPLHRFEAEGVITKNSGADIMKIALVLLCKEFYKKEWLRQGGGDDSVRLLLSVHDEVVFEIRHDRVQVALEIITRVMASPGYMAGVGDLSSYSPRWRVPLIVEPLIGESWAGEYDYGMLMHGKPFKQGDKITDMDVVVGDRTYHRVPSWLKGIFHPPYESLVTEDASLSTVTPSSIVTPSFTVTVPPESVQDPLVVPDTHLTEVTQGQPSRPSTTDPVVKYFTKAPLDLESVKIVIDAISFSISSDRMELSKLRILHLMDGVYKKTIVDPSLRLRVFPEEFEGYLKDRRFWVIPSNTP